MVKIQIIPLKFTILDLNEKNQTFKIKRTKFKECNLYFCLNLLIVISIYNINDFILVILKMSYKLLSKKKNELQAPSVSLKSLPLMKSKPTRPIT
jgi:hypothetical protein